MTKSKVFRIISLKGSAPDAPIKKGLPSKKHLAFLAKQNRNPKKQFPEGGK